MVVKNKNLYLFKRHTNDMCIIKVCKTYKQDSLFWVRKTYLQNVNTRYTKLMFVRKIYKQDRWIILQDIHTRQPLWIRKTYLQNVHTRYLLTVKEDTPCPLGVLFLRKNPHDLIFQNRLILLVVMGTHIVYLWGNVQVGSCLEFRVNTKVTVRS